MMEEPVVLVEHRGPIAIVTLNRPDALNAMSRALSAQLAAAFAGLSDATRVAILTGKGRAFCAGMDLKELSSGESGLQAPDEDQGAGHRRFGMAAFDGPVIGAINGFAITGGLELAMCCDIRIAARGAKFADTHARVGVIPGGRMSALLSRLVGIGRAKEMSLGGNAIDAETAERWGLVNRVVEPAELMQAALKLADDLPGRVVLGTTVRGVFEGKPPEAFSQMSYAEQTRALSQFAKAVEEESGAGVAAHLRYIQRDGVTPEGEPGAAYGATEDRADAEAFEARGREDRHQFRFIVSPEDAAELGDLRGFTRDLMGRMEGDLGTRLDWVAVDHFDTDNPHSHVVLRGVDEDTFLVLALRPDGNVGKARYLIRRLVPALRESL